MNKSSIIEIFTLIKSRKSRGTEKLHNSNSKLSKKMFENDLELLTFDPVLVANTETIFDLPSFFLCEKKQASASATYSYLVTVLL